MDFSCLISCFHKDNPLHLKKCLDSLVIQTMKATEIVFVKDGPLTPELEETLEQYMGQLPFNFVTYPSNKGLGYALKVGLDACSFEIVMRMDTDDICLPDRFEKQYNYMMEHPEIDILGGWSYDIDKDDHIISERKYPTEHHQLYNLLWTNPLIHPTIAFKKSRILFAGSYNPSVVRRQDYELWLRAAHAGLIMANLPHFILKYRFTDNYYKKNGFKVVYKQAIMGYNGAKLLKLPFYTKVAVFVPVVRAMLPPFLVKPVHKLMTLFDPRK